MEEKKNNIWPIIAKVVFIFIIFEFLINTVGRVINSVVYASMLNGKYMIYATSEFVVFILSIILLKIRKKSYIFKERKIPFTKSVETC